MFELKNVIYKDILDIKKLSIPSNKITCIVGESGSGKTTLLRLLNKLISIDKGDITYENKNFNEIDSIELRRKIVMLGQKPIIFDGNVKDNLIIGLKFSEKKIPLDDKLRDMLKYVRLDKRLDENPENFSGGEKQRLALARVLLMEPKTLLLDEPSSALDEKTEDFIIDNVVKYTKNNNRTLVMVTHSNVIAEKYGENIIEIKKGQ